MGCIIGQCIGHYGYNAYDNWRNRREIYNVLKEHYGDRNVVKGLMGNLTYNYIIREEEFKMIKQKVFTVEFGNCKDVQGAYELFKKVYGAGIFALDKTDGDIEELGFPTLIGSRTLALMADENSPVGTLLHNIDTDDINVDIEGETIVLVDRPRYTLFMGERPEWNPPAVTVRPEPIFSPRASMLVDRYPHETTIIDDIDTDNDQEPVKDEPSPDYSRYSRPIFSAPEPDDDDDRHFGYGESDGGGASSGWGSDSSDNSSSSDSGSDCGGSDD